MRTVLIGIDGASFSLLDKLSKTGVMPNLQELKKQSVFKKMMGSLPDNSAVSWASIITGKNPGEHGIFGFTDLIPNTYTIKFPNYNNLECEPFWSKKNNKYSIILNVPFTYPVKPINGNIISGFLSPDIQKSAYPEALIKELIKLDYKTDVDTTLAYKSYDMFLKEIKDVHEKRVSLYRHLWQNNWEHFMIVFTGADRLAHFMMDAYEDKANMYHKEFLNYYKMIDKEIGWIMNEVLTDDNIIMMSDHGMELIKTEVYLNVHLKYYGYLKLKNDRKGNYNDITKNTKSFVLEPGRVYLNYKNKYPNGSVDKNDSEIILNEIIDMFYSIKYNGENVIKKVKRKEEIYHGKKFDEAPDLVLISNDGYSLRGNIQKNEFFDSDSKLTGMHKGDDAFLLVRGAKAKSIVKSNPHVEDIVDIIDGLDR